MLIEKDRCTLIAEKTPGIYEIVNLVNKKRYIGSSTDCRARLLQYRRNLKNNNHYGVHLQRAWDTYGEETLRTYEEPTRA